MIGAKSPHGPVLTEAARGYAEQLYKYRDTPSGIIIHTTGSGPWRRWYNAQQRYSSPHDAARFVYRRISKNSPHFVVCGETGNVAQLVPLEFAAWHTAGAGMGWRYSRRAFQNLPEWWRERWPELRGPGDLLDGRLWRQGTANRLTIGIEVSPPFDHPRGSWTRKAWRSLTWLVQYLAGDVGFPVDPFHVFSHSDANPRTRTTANGRPWDPGYNQWPGRGAVMQMNDIRLPRV